MATTGPHGSAMFGNWAVQGLCSDAGGMGTVLFVNHIDRPGETCVLKHCKIDHPEVLTRFRREVRIMQNCTGSSHVVPILEADLQHEPPFFVMPFFGDGDLMSRSPELRGNMGFMEYTLMRMLDCVDELHQRGIIHRDIKPQNFLVNSSCIVVSDLGLCCESDSSTGFTRTAQWAGTQGYMPPEFFAAGGFRDAEPSADIYMLGKSFYVMLTGYDPSSMFRGNVPPQLWPIIERCCTPDKALRYQNVSQLKASLQVAFDAILGRVVDAGRVYATLNEINENLRSGKHVPVEDLVRFIEELSGVDEEDQRQVCLQLPPEFFRLLAEEPTVQSRLASFLVSYQRMVERADYGWAYAETIADNMKILFLSWNVASADKAEALRNACLGAIRQNRFNALDTCRDLIRGVTDAELSQRIHDVLMGLPQDFVQGIDIHSCKAMPIRAAIQAANQAASASSSSRSDDDAPPWE